MKWKVLVVLGMMNGVYGSEESTPSPVKHFGAKEEKPGEAFSAALRNLDKFGYVPIDIPEDPEPMSSAGSVEKLFAKDPQGRLTPLVNGERTRAFSLGAVGAGSLAARRRAKSQDSSAVL